MTKNKNFFPSGAVPGRPQRRWCTRRACFCPRNELLCVHYPCMYACVNVCVTHALDGLISTHGTNWLYAFLYVAICTCLTLCLAGWLVHARYSRGVHVTLVCMHSCLCVFVYMCVLLHLAVAMSNSQNLMSFRTACAALNYFHGHLACFLWQTTVQEWCGCMLRPSRRKRVRSRHSCITFLSKMTRQQPRAHSRPVGSLKAIGHA